MVHGPQAPPLRWLDPLAAADPGIPPAPPDPAGHVGDVLLVSCPGAGRRAVGKPGARRGHVGPALGSRQRMGDGERGGEGWVVWSWRLGPPCRTVQSTPASHICCHNTPLASPSKVLLFFGNFVPLARRRDPLKEGQ